MKLKNYSSFLIIIFLLCLTTLSAQENKQTQYDQVNPFEQLLGKGAAAYGSLSPRLPGFGNFIKVKGDVLVTGNQIINRTTDGTAGTGTDDVKPVLDASGQPTNLAALTARANTNYNGGRENDRLNFEYIDIDTDNTTFSSSTANLEIRNLTNNTPGGFCKKIVYAGLYWAAFYPYDRINNTYDNNSVVTATVKYPIVNNNWNQVKFKVPGGTYQTLTADTAADAVGDEDDIVFGGFGPLGSSPFTNNSTYVCYKNVTNLLKSLADANGTYAVADMLAGRGNDQGGLAGGWSLVVVFESPSYPLKYVSVVDGCKILYNDSGNASNRRLDYTFSGFKTLPTGPVNARIGVAALEGDKPTNNDFFKNDVFQVKNTSNNFVNLSSDFNRSQPDYPDNNFFQSNLSRPNNFPNKNGINITRSPNCSNTLGFDLDIVNLDNVSKTLITNGQTSIDVRVETSGDDIIPYLSTFSVDIAEAKVIFTKVIKKTNGTLVANNGTVALGEQLNYVIGFQNIGTDNATNVTITDVLPANIVFDQNILTASLPAGVTLTSYNAVTRLLTLAVADNLVEAGDFRTEFNIEFLVEKDCTKFEGPCSNIISNSAKLTYTSNGIVTNVDSGNVENAATCVLESTPTPTVFNVNTSGCSFTKTVVWCNGNLTLTAPAGYASYAWTRTSPTSATLGTNANQTINGAGTFSVLCTPIAGCSPVTITYNVYDILNASAIPHPVTGVAPQVTDLVCSAQGLVTKVIALCGNNDSMLINTGISNANSIKWQVKNTTGCIVTPPCPNATNSCYTDIPGTANKPNFLADTDGDYRIVIQYDGPNSCTRTFYFKVTKGNQAVSATNTDIICGSAPGIITVVGFPSGYEYQVQGPFPATTTSAWQTSPNISVGVNPSATTATGPGTYTAFIRVTGGPANSCVYKVPNISVLKVGLDIQLKVTQPPCSTDTGSITVFANGVAPYLYTIRSGNQTGAIVQTSGSTTSTQVTFTGLLPGNYTARIDATGCTTWLAFTITRPTLLTATAGVNIPYTFCAAGEVLVTAGGGTSPYLYSIDGGLFQSSSRFPINDTNTHTFTVKDVNECAVTTAPFTMPFAAKPTFTVTPTDIVCDPQSGALNFTTLTNPGGFTFAYEYSGGCFRTPTYLSSPSPTISNLVADSYLVRVKCTLGTAVCYVNLPLDVNGLHVPVLIKATYPPLTATGGVSALAGCFNTTEGEIRITNPQGGSSNYSYSFDNDVTYQTDNFITKAPGTYQTFIKDNVTGCKFQMEVILLPKPTPPTFAVTNTTFNCNGTSTGTVTITNGPNFAYQYFIKYSGTSTFVPNPNTAFPNIFENVPCNSDPHQIRIDYRSTNIPTKSELLFEDFGTGSNTALPPNTIAPAYCYNDQCSRVCNNTTDPNDPYRDRLEDGQYVVTRKIIPNNGAWHPFVDHTSTVPSPSNPTGTLNPNGRFLAINIGAAAGANGRLYSKRIYDVIPNQDIIVEAYVANLLRANLVGGVDPGFTFEIRTSTGALLAQQPMLPTVDSILRSDTWQLKQVFLNPGAVVTPYLVFNVLSASTEYGGNDAVIDDIRVYQIPRACVTTETFPLTVPCDKKFTAKVDSVKNVDCFGTSTGAITISAENFVTPTSTPPNNSFEYSTNGGLNWLSSTISPIVVTTSTAPPFLPLGAGSYTIKVRYNSTVTGCSFDLPQTISQPTQLTVTAIKTDATCAANNLGTITATGAGGFGAYQYQLLTTSLAVVPSFGYGSANINNTTGVFSNVPVGSYFVQVRDFNICTADSLAPVSISGTTDPQPFLATPLPSCFTNANLATLTIGVTGGVGPFTYSISPPAAGVFVGNTIKVNAGVAYTITVIDSKGCDGSFSPPVVSPELTVNLTQVQTTNCGADIFNGTIVGGLAPFTYQVSSNNGATFGAAIAVPVSGTGSTFSYTAAVSGVPISGTFVIKVTDSRTPAACTALSTAFVVTPIVTITPTAPVISIATCNNPNGSVTIGADTGTSPYTYSFDGSPFSSTVTYGTLAAATYPYKIKDSKGCEYIGSVTVPSSGAITGEANFSPYICGTNGNSIITFTGMPANSVALGYQYSINGGSTFQLSPVFGTASSGNLNGTYVCIIKDANNCPKPAGILTIPALNSVVTSNISFNETVLASCSSTGTLLTATGQVNVTSANTIIKYEITAPASAVTNVTGATSGLFTGLVAGTTYTFQVTDSKNCQASNSFTIATPNSISVAGNKTNAKCKGESNGTLNYTVSNFLPGTYSYIITNVTAGTTIVPLQTLQTSATISSVVLNNLPAGTYKIVVTSTQTGCTDTIDLIIAEPAIALTASNTPTAITCSASGIIGAQVQLNGINGGSPYTYTLLSPSNTPISGINGLYTGLTAVGTYKGSVTDNFGCTVTTTFTLANPAAPTVTVNPATLCFNGSTADVVINVTGGLAPYQYNLDNAGFPALAYNNITLNSSNNFTLSLSQGAHTIIIRGANGCFFTIPAFTIRPQLAVSTTFKDADCSASPPANISGTITGGTAPFGYQTSTDGGITFLPALPTLPALPNTLGGNLLSFTPPTPATLPAVTYVVRVIDSKGCFADSLPITINPIVAVTGDNLPPTDATCGAANGTVTINALTGTAPFTYRFDGVFPFTFTTQNVYSGAAGAHSYQVRDSKGCTSDIYFVTIGSPGGVVGTASSVDLSCNAGSGTITFATPTAGTGPFTYSINGTSGTFVSTNVFGNPTPLAVGTYVCVIKDAFGCPYVIGSETINPINPPTEISFGQSNTVCTALGNSATVTLTPTAVNTITKYEIILPLVAVIDNGTSNVFNGLASGTYTFQITDSKNCKLIRTFEVNPPVQIAVSGQLISNVKCQLTATGAIRFNVSSFTGTYSYSVVNTGLNSTSVPSQIGQTASIINFAALRAGTYTITVTSSTGCTATADVTVTEAPVALTAAPTFTPLPCPTGTASITVNASGGVGSYTYVLNRPSPQLDVTQISPNDVFTGLTLAGLYTITITDAAGCIITRDVTLVTPVNPTVSVNASTFCVTAGIANVSVSSSLTAPFEYSLDGGTYLTATTNPFIVNVTPSATPHTIRVKDNLQCVSGLTSFTINPALTVTTTLTPAKCDASGNPVAAIISGTVSNGYPNYGYQVHYSATLPALPLPAATAFIQATPVAMGVGITNYSYTTANGAGYYVIRFTDANGCKVDSNLINVTPLIPITATNNITNVLCNGDSTGAVTIVPSGGVPPYQVNFNNLGFSTSLSYSGLSASNVLAIDPGTIYNYVIRDSNGCLFSSFAIVKNLYDKIDITPRIVPLLCILNNPDPANGEICVESLVGGLAPFQYILNPTNGQPQQTFTAVTGQNHCFTGLEFGVFNLTVVDANNCTIQENNLLITSPPSQLNVDATTIPTVTCTPNSGSVIVKATGALIAGGGNFWFAIQQNPALAYTVGSPLWFPGTFTAQVGAIPANYSYTFTGLTAGNLYQFVVYDELGKCYFTDIADAPVSQFSTIVGTPTPNKVSCLNSTDASVNLLVQNYTGTQLTYQIFTSPFNVPVVGGGPFTITGQTANVPFTIPNIGLLAPGSYSILMTEIDGTFAGCQTKTAVFEIANGAAALVLPIPSFTDANCNPLSGTVTATASGGSSGFQYQIFTTAAAALLPTYDPTSGSAYLTFLSTFNSNISTFNVNAGSYFVYVKDATGCLERQPVTVGTTPNPQVTLGAVLDQCTSTGASYTFDATATPLFGVAPYKFSINGIDQGTSATAGVAVPITVNNSGTYVVTITDKNGCTGTASVTIYPPIAVSALETVATVCPLNNAGQAQATATGGSGSFNYTISPSGTINLTTGLATGLTAVLPFTTYTIRATDALPPFCFNETTINLSPAQSVLFTLAQTPVSCNDSVLTNDNGTITVTLDPTMNEGPYAYAISPNVGSLSGNTFTSLPAGPYNITVTSAKSCFDVKPITVGAPLLPVTAALQLGTPAAFSCTNTTTSLTIIAGGGVGGYTYSIDGTNYLTTNVFNDIPDTGTILLPQVINYFVKDANGCIATNSVTLTPLSKVTATVALSGTALTCTTGEQVTVTATNGSGNYEYELQGSGIAASATNTFSLTNAGTTAITYTFKVKDLTSGCSTLATYIVNPLPVLTVNASQDATIGCNGASTASITFNVSSNFVLPTFTYNLFKDGTLYVPFPLTTSSSASNNVITNLPAGNYTVNVFNAPLCDKSSNNVLIEQPSAVVLSFVSKTKDNCQVGAIVTVSATGGTSLPSGYTYAFVQNGVAPIAANYTSSASATLDFSINPDWDVYALDSNNCPSNKIDVDISEIKDPEITLPLITNQCDLLATNFIIAPTTVTVDPLATPLTYAITSSNSVVGANFFPAIPNIPIPTIPTTVWLFVKDANGCTDAASVIVYPKLGIDTDIIRQPTCVPLNDGQIKFTASGGSGNYVLTPPTINPSAGAIYNAATNTFSGLIFDVDYTITFTDSDTGCTKTSEIVRLTKPLDPTFNAVPTIVKCNVNGTPSIDGTITVNLTGTNLDFPYSYQLTSGPVTYVVAPAVVLNASTHVFTGLPTGTYTVRVTSNLGCVIAPDATVFVGAPLAFTATAAATTFKCDTSNNAPQTATITITPQLAGLPVLPAGYTFSLNGIAGTFDSTNTFNIVDTGLPQTFANLSVKDANGCIASVPTVTIQPLPAITAAPAVLVTRLSCSLGETFQVNVTPVAPALPLNYYLYEVLATGQSNNTGLFTLLSLNAANYTIKVTNTVTGCTFLTNYEVVQLPDLTVTATPGPAIDCFGGTTSLTFTVGGYSGTYDYEVFNGTTSVATGSGTTTVVQPAITGLFAGNYTVKVTATQAPRCSKTSSSQSLVQPASAVALTVVSNVPANCNVGAIVTVSASGGNTTGGYTYAFVQDGVVPTAANYTSSAQATLDPAINLNWDVYALDANNCPSGKLDVTISRTPNPVITSFGLFADNKCDANATSYSFASSIVASGFTTSNSPLTYSLTGAAPFYTLANLPQVPVPTTGTVVYQLTVKDANGCTTTSTVGAQSLTVYPHISSTSAITNFASCDLVAGIPTGVITVAPSGGSGNFTLSFVGAVPATATITGNVLSGLSPQTYTIRITDNVTSCAKDIEVIMPVPTPVTLNPFAKTDVTCDGGTDGTITVNLATLPIGANNNPIYQYALFLSSNLVTPIRANQTNNSFINLPEGSYVVEVTSAKGCKAQQTITIDDPDPIVVNTPIFTQFGCTTNNIGNQASIFVNSVVGNVTGGSGVYIAYEFINTVTGLPVRTADANNLLNIANLEGGTYIVKVYDNKGCFGTSLPITIAPFIKIDTATVTVVGSIRCDDLTEDILVGQTVIYPAIGGPYPAPNLEYTITGTDTTVYGPFVNNNGAFNNLPIGKYKIIIKNITTGCVLQVNHFVNDPSVYRVIIENIVAVKCYGDSTGSATIRMVNASLAQPFPNQNLPVVAAPFSYIIRNNATGLPVQSGNSAANATGITSITGLPFGNYTAELTLTANPNMCKDSFAFSISQPLAPLTVVATQGSQVGCSPKQGSINVLVSGGTPFTNGIDAPYKVELINTTPVLLGAGPFAGNSTTLEEGIYQVLVTDANGCVPLLPTFVTLAAPVDIFANFSVAQSVVNCPGDTTTINLTGVVSGGQGSNYTFNYFEVLAGGGSVKLEGPTSATFFETGAGTYTVLIEDGLGCSRPFGPFTINNPSLVVPTLVTSRGESCSLPQQLTLGASGGTGPYTYSSDNGLNFSAATFTTATPVVIDVAPGVTYKYIVKDALGCEAEIGTTTQIVPLISLLSQSQTNITCFGESDGSIQVKAQGGFNVDYSYSISTISGVGPTNIGVNTTGLFENLTYGAHLGVYYITVVSTDSCPKEFPFTLIQPKQFIVIPDPDDVKCNGENNGQIVLEIENAVGALQYAISTVTNNTTANQFFDIPGIVVQLSAPGVIPVRTGVRFIIPNLAPDSYLLTVKDQGSCPYTTTAPIVIEQPFELLSNLTANSEIQELCKGDKNASFSITIKDGTAPYFVSIDNNGTGTYVPANITVAPFGHTFTGLEGGNHTVYVRDSNGCEVVPYVVQLNLPVFLNPVVDATYPCPEDAPGIKNYVIISVHPSNNLADVTFSIDGGSFLPSNNAGGFRADNLTVGTHTFEVQHTNGCRQPIAPNNTFDIRFVDPLALKLTDGNLNQIIAIASGGVAPYNYSFNGVSTGQDNTYIYDKTGNYSVTIVDTSNCKLTVTKAFNFIDIFIPNFFSPNGDGENDNWSPQNTYNYKNLVFFVFDRYGRKIVSLKEGQQWDGKYEGEELPTGDYWYIVKTEESSTREFVGNFTLYR